MSQLLIRQAFEVALGTWATANSVSVAWENVVFTPPAGKYARAYLLPGETTSFDLTGAHRSYKGVFQVTLYMPQGVGMRATETLVESLDTAFQLTAPLSAGGLNVWIASPMTAGPAGSDADRISVPVSCTYQAHKFV